MDYDIIIIGGGPAGLTAALYASRARLKTLVLESFSVPGQAIITDCIENYPGFPEGINGFALADKFKRQAEKFGAIFKVSHVKSIKVYKAEEGTGWRVDGEEESYTSMVLIIASGARPKRLGVPGEDRLKGRGVSYCATCDGALYKDKEIVVVGGGDTAIEEALFLTRFAKRVTLVHRRDRLRATKILQERALSNKKMSFIWSSNVIDILGKEKVGAVRVKNVKTEEEKDISCEGVFIFVGYLPNTDLVKDIIKLDNNGYIVADDDMNTSRKGIFVCGDARKKILRQVVTACGDGATAAFSAQHYIEEQKGTAYK